MAENLSYYTFMLIYMAWAVSYFFPQLLTPRKFVTRPRIYCFFIILPMLFLSMYLRNLDFNFGTFMVQFSILLVALLLFRDKLRLRLVSYVTFMMVLISIEVYASTLFLFIKQLFIGSSQVTTALDEIIGIPDMILITLLDVVMGVAAYCKLTPLLKHLLPSIKSWTVFQLIAPLYLPFITQFFIYQRTSYFGIGIFLYFAAFLIYLPVFLKGVQSVRKQEKERIMKEESIQLAKAQLEASMKMEAEYQTLRKWNHDIENHLLSLSYLMDMKKYEEASVYYSDFFVSSDIQTLSDKGGSYHEHETLHP